MSLTRITKIRDVRGVTDLEKAAIQLFMQGAIYSWINVNGEARFAVRDLMGGNNRHWNGTPLDVLYQKHFRNTKDPVSANKRAGQDLGWLVKQLLHDDKRQFRQVHGYVSNYEWAGK